MTIAALALTCPVCGVPADMPIYERNDGAAISSTAAILRCPTRVHCCRACAHIHTQPLDDLDAYYDTDYNQRLEAHDADDLYEMRDERPVFRTEQQAKIALQKLSLPAGARVLDYGSGKGATLRRIVAARSDIHPYVFDVSANYRGEWSDFVPPDAQASYDIPPSWYGTFDAVLSFFVLEHVTEPRRYLATIRRLLKPGGAVHVVVPNVRQNVGDLLVVDHVNHFMPSSIRSAFESEGFDSIIIDESVHAAAYVVGARRSDSVAPGGPRTDVTRYIAEAHRFAQTWQDAGARIRAFEAARGGGRSAAIYGSGFYGIFIATSLHDPATLTAFYDHNPHQQNKSIMNVPVRAPGTLGDDVDILYVGLNPAFARRVIDGVDEVRRRPRELFFL